MIGGNVIAKLQSKTRGEANAIGEREHQWTDVADLKGWLDYQGGQNNYGTFDAKVQESTHVFICDYQALVIDSENGRMIVNGDVYDILLMDDPMNMHQHLEIYLKYVGGGQGVS